MKLFFVIIWGIVPVVVFHGALFVLVKIGGYMSDLWLEYAAHGHCGLCGNTGVVNTLENAITPNGTHVGVKAFCICPNGRALKGSDITVLEWLYDDGELPEKPPIGIRDPSGERLTLKDLEKRDKRSESKGSSLTVEEAMEIIASANEKSLKIRKGESVPRAIRVSDKGGTAYSIKIIDLKDT